jgi:hypothetical protein
VEEGGWTFEKLCGVAYTDIRISSNQLLISL